MSRCAGFGWIHTVPSLPHSSSPLGSQFWSSTSANGEHGTEVVGREKCEIRIFPLAPSLQGHCPCSSLLPEGHSSPFLNSNNSLSSNPSLALSGLGKCILTSSCALGYSNLYYTLYWIFLQSPTMLCPCSRDPGWCIRKSNRCPLHFWEMFILLLFPL